MYQLYIKRILDIIFSVILLIFSMPIFIILILIIKISDGGPAFYNAERLGKGMKKFKMYKFRSMKVNSPDIRNEDGSTFNSENDNRLTKIGKFIRKTSLDELPQLFNVLIGNMSFVGPRPSPLGNEDKYPNYCLKKFEVLPGITGYNQVVLRNRSTLDERYRNDVFYVNNISILFDLKIILLTVKSVIKIKNIYRN